MKGKIKQDRGELKEGEERKSNGCTLSFYVNFSGD